MFRSDFGACGESTTKLLLKINQYLCNPAAFECFVCFFTKFKNSIVKIPPTFLEK